MSYELCISIPKLARFLYGRVLDSINIIPFSSTPPDFLGLVAAQYVGIASFAAVEYTPGSHQSKIFAGRCDAEYGEHNLAKAEMVRLPSKQKVSKSEFLSLLKHYEDAGT